MALHSTRAQRRETARALAKEMLKQGRKNYRTEFLWTVLSFLAPLAWSETVSGPSIWRLVVGWFLWLVPLILALHVLWRWSSDVKKFLLLRYLVAAVAVLGLAALSSLSIWNASRPTFLLMWPGLAFSDGSTRAYYWAAERRSVQNPTIIVWDEANPTNTITLRPGNVDPRIGGFADYFRFQPAKLGHERLTIFTQSKDIDTDESLIVETRGPALFPSWKAIIRNSRTRRIIFQCESDDFPEKSNLQTCPLNPLAVDNR